MSVHLMWRDPIQQEEKGETEPGGGHAVRIHKLGAVGRDPSAEPIVWRQGEKKKGKHVGAAWDLKFSTHPFWRHQKPLHLAQEAA